MGRSRYTDCADNQKILLEAYVKIIPCRKVTIETLSRNGNILSTQQKENFSEPVIVNISRQEIVSNNVEDFTVIENDTLITQNLFQLNQAVTSKISVKCPFVDPQDRVKTFQDPSNGQCIFQSSAKQLEVDIGIEIFKKPFDRLPCSEPENDFKTDVEKGRNLLDTNDRKTKIDDESSNLEPSDQWPPDPSLIEQESCNSGDATVSLASANMKSDKIVLQSVNTHTDVDTDTDVVKEGVGKESTNSLSQPLEKSEDSKLTSARRSSRRATTEKYTLALQLLRPKSSKNTDKLLMNSKVVENNINKKNKNLKENVNIEKATKRKNKNVNVEKGSVENLTDLQQKSISTDSADKHTPRQRTSTRNVTENKNAVNHHFKIVGCDLVGDPENKNCDKEDLNEKSDDEIHLIQTSKSITTQVDEPAYDESVMKTKLTKSKRRSCVAKTIDSMACDVDNVAIDTENNNELTLVVEDGNVNLDNKATQEMDSDKIIPDNNNDEFVLENVTKKGKKKKRLKERIDSNEIPIPSSPQPFKSLETTCKICFKTLVEGGLTKHMKLHMTEKKYPCPLCDKIFTTEYLFNLHQGTHKDQTSDGKFVCTMCNKVYANKSCLFKHRRLGPCSTEFKCEMCGISFSSEKSLYSHNNQEHVNLSTGNYRCPECKKMFVTRGGLIKHISLKKCRTNLFCHLCKKRFSRVAYFERHMLNHREFVPKTYQCDLCGNFLSSSFSLQKHVSRHKNIRNHSCSVCRKTFLDPSGLRVHMRMHNKERPFICDMCGRSFSQSGHLLRHKLQSHQIGQYPFVCQLCGKGFVDKRNIESHTKTHEKRSKREDMKRNRPRKVKLQSPIKTEVEPIPDIESNVIHIEAGYDISDLLGAHVTQTNSDGSQTIISSAANLQSIEQILQAASEANNTIEYMSTEEIPVDQVYSDHQTFINIEDIKVENSINDENIIYTVDDGVGAMESIPASDLGILAETAQQFQINEDNITYYIIKKEGSYEH